MFHSFGHSISIIYKYLHIWINDQLEPLGIGSGQFIFLNHIARSEGISQKELSRDVVVDKATTAKAVRKLVDLGYIEKKVNEYDMRIHNLFLTDRGRDIIPTVRAALKNSTGILQTGMSGEEIAAAADILNKMEKNISRAVYTSKLADKEIL